MFKEKVEQFFQSFVESNDAQLLSCVFEEINEHVTRITIETTNNGFFIGKQGRTINDIEVILETMAQIHQYEKRIQLNVGDYRQKYEEKIKLDAIERAKYVSKTGKIYAFPPMNSYERRLIHTAISESVFGILVKTESVGEGKERHTILRNK